MCIRDRMQFSLARTARTCVLSRVPSVPGVGVQAGKSRFRPRGHRFFGKKMGLCDSSEAENCTVSSVSEWGSKGAHKIVLSNGDLEVVVSTYGATLLSAKFPSKEGKLEEITLNFDHSVLADHEEWEDLKPACFGGVPGRYANRIANATFELDGEKYSLQANNGPNCLHGGIVGFHQQIWTHELVQGGVKLSLASPDGQEGFPGNLSVTCEYTLTGDNCLHVQYSGTTDKATPCNLTNHAYWNLSGDLKSKVYEHHIKMPSSHYLPVDDTCIPTGELKPVDGTPFDLRAGVKLSHELLKQNTSDDISGFDHCFVVADTERTPQDLKLVAVVQEQTSGREMAVFTDQPGVQLYTANFLPKDTDPHSEHMGFCLETQGYPDSPNQPAFPNTILRPGQTYTHHTVHKFSHC
eukprot:TRINITY_DN13390_c0_g1_i3.p1 TRINITY_DN13390_c0_g1~~TRINITY_DN13390_c0_g1_i3.p1  ORF type:complete len:408 (+),score=78.76 TRINITY_DN13390_c0_g1_i3:142-1365(+)